MLDQLKVDIVGESRYDDGPGWISPNELDLDVWAASVTTYTGLNPVSRQPSDQHWRHFRNRVTGFHASGPLNHGPWTVDYSGPRLVGAQNGKLVRGQDDLDLIATRADESLREVSPDASYKISRVVMIEIPWHFEGFPCTWVPFYAALKYPRIERLPVVWREEFLAEDLCIHGATDAILRKSPCSVSYSPTAVTWAGDKLRIALYDKVSQMRLGGRMSPVMRLEFKLEDRLATGLLDSNGSLCFASIYERYRNLAGLFRSYRVDRSHNGTAIDFLLYQYIQGHIPEHEFQSFLSELSTATVYRYMERLRSISTVWAMEPGIVARLPVDGPPEAPDVVSPPKGGAAS